MKNFFKKCLDSFWSKKLAAYDCKFSSGVSSLSKAAKLELEEHVRLSSVKIKSNKLKIGAYTYIRSGCELYEIGRFCSIGNNVVIGLEKDKHPTNWLSTSLFTKEMEAKYDSRKEYKPTVIGNDCWIGRGAIILSGIKIGDGAIVAAGAIVTEDILPYGIYAVPAKLVKYRFSPDLIHRLIKSKRRW